MIRRLLIYVLAIVAVASGVLTRHQLQPPAAKPQITAAAALDASFADLSGQPHRMDEWLGKVLIVNFWASWCPPCIEEMPGFVRLQQEFGNRGLQFVGIITGDDLSAAKEFLASAQLNYPILNGEPGVNDWTARLGNDTDILPLSAVFDRSGKLVHMEYGLFKRDEVLKVIEPLL